MSTFTNQTKSCQDTIYLVSESLDYYLVGMSELETLVTVEATNFSGQTKNSITLTNQTKN